MCDKIGLRVIIMIAGLVKRVPSFQTEYTGVRVVKQLELSERLVRSWQAIEQIQGASVHTTNVTTGGGRGPHKIEEVADMIVRVFQEREVGELGKGELSTNDRG
jgi:hypothetical protein